ncbi:MAG: hypothetical protein ACFFH0_10620 [Promethearchaeota archaeon]
MPSDSYFSYFNSPYIGHRRSSSVDVYPSHKEWEGPAFSPIDGKIVRLKEVSMGAPKVFPSEDRDYAIAIRPEEESSHIVRILHCRPSVSVGESVAKGDEIGGVLRSRFFCFWTGPHYHVEVLPEIGFHRSSKSSPITVDFPTASSVEMESPKEIECEVLESSADVLVGVSKRASYAKAGDLQGHLAFTRSAAKGGILDAGVPHYEHGGVVAGGLAQEDKAVKAWSAKIGVVTSAGDSFLQFKITEHFSPRVDGELIRGISNHVYSKTQTVKGLPPVYLIPKKIGQFEERYNEGDVFVLSF